MKEAKGTINIWLLGGLGNVLFQILAFNVISKKENRIFFVKLLTEKNIITKCIGWTIHDSLFDELIDKKSFNEVNFFKSLVIIVTSFISKKLNRKFKLSTFYTSLVQMDGNVSNNIFGYFQYNEFLQKNQEELLHLGHSLRVKYALERKYPVVVHYRKGDSVWAAKHTKYYDEIKLLLKKEVLPILIVTDNLQAAKQFFSEMQNVSVISSKNGLDDFKYLVSAEKLYCAPSTFSWWAAHSLCAKSEIILPKFFQENLGIYVNSSKVRTV